MTTAKGGVCARGARRTAAGVVVDDRLAHHVHWARARGQRTVGVRRHFIFIRTNRISNDLSAVVPRPHAASNARPRCREARALYIAVTDRVAAKKSRPTVWRRRPQPRHDVSRRCFFAR